MKSFLADILGATREELGRTGNLRKPRASPHRNSPVRDFRGAIAGKDCTSVIAEIKFASPSAGVIRPPEDPVPLAECLESAGVAALSIVTESHVFQGDPVFLKKVARAVSIPVLCKDFFLDEIQVEEARGRGADAVLLITRILDPGRLSSLLACCRSMGLKALVEVGTRKELDRALAAGAEVVGINNRDLDSFDVDLGRFGALASAVPAGVALVSESGVKRPGDVQTLRNQGADAVLVGTAIMASSDPASAARELVQAGRALIRGQSMEGF
jgi:indole-3-glycerol phosphate synthase